MDGPSTQLANDLGDALYRALRPRRPLLHHLNADTSWLLQLPRPSSAVSRTGRHWYNILIDPWLSGSQSDVASWFSKQWHAHTPTFGSIEEVEDLARDIESLSSLRRSAPGAGSYGHPLPRSPTEGSLIDVIVISHEFTDHCHKETLLACNRDIPVFTTPVAVRLIRSWGHFHSVLDTPAFAGHDTDWRTLSAPPLPDWLTIAKVTSEKDALYYHSAILIAFDCHEKAKQRSSARYSNGVSDNLEPPDIPAEAVIYTPHGVDAVALDVIPLANPPINTLALLHGLHDIALTMQQLNMGAHNGLKAHRLLRPKYWFGTHDEVKRGAGLVGWLLKRKVISLQDALKMEQEQEKSKGKTYGSRPPNDVHFMDLENGESIVLST